MNPLSKMCCGIAAALALVMIIAFVWLMLANAHLKTQLAEVQANATACHLANDTFAAIQARQNKEVQALQAQAVARAKEAQKQALVAQKAAQTWFHAADQLQKQKLSGDVCKNAAALFDSYMGRGQ